ncbi:GNAT family N-acetyltransferase [Nocardioides panacisoli]|uniref:GNAT family N-acetyltransferase n=1 Tax=Nocardioides panacisoli TaxID=627624 RepID=UPI001C6354B7|nr:GNAT family N-acetyltransferase [Nocardioides panacisoli]QYJ03352.1 GNAT family N-acetyltransferase [Nocardioides panacisoli]
MTAPHADRAGPRVVVRRRERSDLDALAAALVDQQPHSRYPFRDPLPIPVADFLRAEDAVAAWTAELDGRPVGHGCWVGPPSGFPAAAGMNRACAAAHDCAVDRLAWVSALFVGREARGLGVGRRLLEAVVDDLRAAGRRGCLEVLPVVPTALRLYEATGWQEVQRHRPEWLARAPGGADAPAVRVMVLPEATPDVTPGRRRTSGQ